MNRAAVLSRRAFEIRSMLDTVSASIITGQPRGSTKKDFTDMYNRVVLTEIERDEKVDEANRVLDTVMKAAEQLTDLEECVILHTFIDGWSFQDIANEQKDKDIMTIKNNYYSGLKNIPLNKSGRFG